MRFTTLTAAVAAVLFASEALAQRGGGGMRNRWRRAEEITNRVGAFFVDTPGPAAEGDKVAGLETCELVRAAVAAEQLSVLYLVDLTADGQTRGRFEGQLFMSDELGIELRAFHCGRIDLAKNAALGAHYGEAPPLFVVFDEEGKATEVAMTGYKPARAALTKALEKAASGAVKPPLPTFAKKYGKFVRDLEQLLTKMEAVERERNEETHEGKRKQLEKELAQLEREQEKLLDVERKLLERMRFPERPANAQRLGAPPRWGRGGAGGGGPGGGGAGGGGPGGGGAGGGGPGGGGD